MPTKPKSKKGSITRKPTKTVAKHKGKTVMVDAMTGATKLNRKTATKRRVSKETQNLAHKYRTQSKKKKSKKK
jgi:LDH2 family malate/lactate/ureidoglycolate dehydrogenase